VRLSDLRCGLFDLLLLLVCWLFAILWVMRLPWCGVCYVLTQVLIVVFCVFNACWGAGFIVVLFIWLVLLNGVAGFYSSNFVCLLFVVCGGGSVFVIGLLSGDCLV